VKNSEKVMNVQHFTEVPALLTNVDQSGEASTSMINVA
jgi:hypothetical protein